MRLINELYQQIHKLYFTTTYQFCSIHKLFFIYFNSILHRVSVLFITYWTTKIKIVFKVIFSKKLLLISQLAFLFLWTPPDYCNPIKRFEVNKIFKRRPATHLRKTKFLCKRCTSTNVLFIKASPALCTFFIFRFTRTRHEFYVLSVI